MQASSSQPTAGTSSASERSLGKPLFDRDTLDNWCERGILGLVLAILVFGPVAFGAVDVPQILAIQGLTIGVLVLWMIRVWVSNSYRLLWAPISWAVILFLGYAIVRYRMLLAENGVEYAGRQELILVLIYGGLFFAVLNNLSRQESAQTIVVGLLSVGTLISLYALYQFLTKSGNVLWAVQYPGYLGRGSGTYFCPNHLGGFLEMILPLGLACTLAGRFNATSKVFLGYATLAIFTGIGVTVSRGAWVATGLGLLVFFGLLMRHRGQRLAGILFFILLVCGFTFFLKNLAVLQRRVGVTSAETKMDVVRMELWRPTYQMWRDHPWWGVGPAQFDHRFRKYRPDDIQQRPDYAHNDYLNTLADWGAVGLGLIALTIGLLFIGVFQSWKFVQRSNDLTTKKSNRSAVVLGAAAGMLAILAHSVVDFNMHIPANAIVAITLMALITGHLRFATERFWFKLGWLGKSLLTVIVLVLIGYLGQQGWIRAREYALLERAGNATELGAKMAALKAANALEPRNFKTTYEAGETLRLASWEGLGNYRQLTTEAIPWFELGTKLNQFDPFNYLRWGMCLHWLDRTNEAGPYFEKALALDPNNYKVESDVGWHYFQLGDLDKAEGFYKRAVFQANWDPEYYRKKYETGVLYLNLIEQRRQKEK